MSTIVWGSFSTFEAGVDRGVVYIPGLAVAWNGLTEVDEVVVGGESSSVYFDGVKSIDMISPEEFSLAISAYTYPAIVEDLESGEQTLGFSYRTQLSPGYLIHLVYNATLLHDSKVRNTKDDSVEPDAFSWTLFTVPVKVPGAYPAAHLVVDTNGADPESVAALELILYGDATHDPRLPDPDEVVAIFSVRATLVVVDHGDGTWTATGPEEAIQMLDETTFAITWPSVVYISEDTYTISTL